MHGFCAGTNAMCYDNFYCTCPLTSTCVNYQSRDNAFLRSLLQVRKLNAFLGTKSIPMRIPQAARQCVTISINDIAIGQDSFYALAVQHHPVGAGQRRLKVTSAQTHARVSCWVNLWITLYKSFHNYYRHDYRLRCCNRLLLLKQGVAENNCR